MKTFKALLQIKINIDAENKLEVENVLENMDYSFIDPRGEGERMDSEIQEQEIFE